MVVLDWMVVALVGGFVATAAAASVLDRRRAGPARMAEARLWSVAEAAWVGSRPPREARLVTTLTMPTPLVVTAAVAVGEPYEVRRLRFVRSPALRDCE